LTQHRSARSPAAGDDTTRLRGIPQGLLDRQLDLDRNEVTDIIPFNEFGEIGGHSELDFSDAATFGKETQVLRAPELDDLHDTGSTPMRTPNATPARIRTGGTGVNLTQTLPMHPGTHPCPEAGSTANS
jgi:hypothetical protein